jgi:hypothetical protein
VGGRNGDEDGRRGECIVEEACRATAQRKRELKLSQAQTRPPETMGSVTLSSSAPTSGAQKAIVSIQNEALKGFPPTSELTKRLRDGSDTSDDHRCRRYPALPFEDAPVDSAVPADAATLTTAVVGNSDAEACDPGRDEPGEALG